jgi:outer membrane lipoprotein-sorting protein
VVATARSKEGPELNILRRLPLPRLLLACAMVVAVGVLATAIASAVGSGPVPAPKPLAQAVHDALAGTSVEGLSARVTLTNRLLEGANVASADGQGSGLLDSPLVNGGSGRLWISDGRVRLELQAEKGDLQVIYDGHAVSVYDAATNTLYRYTPSQATQDQSSSGQDGAGGRHEAPSVAKIEEAIAHIEQHAQLSEATPTDVAGQPAYTVRVSPRQGGSLIGGAEVSFDADHGIPLRAAVYSSSSSAPVIELAATEVSYGPIASSTFEFAPPANAKVEELNGSSNGGTGHDESSGEARPTSSTSGHGITTIGVLQKPLRDPATEKDGTIEGLPTVDVGGAKASELKTALGTILTFERSGIRYVVAGAVPAAAVEAVAKGL